jgi:hypothetical protein
MTDAIFNHEKNFDAEHLGFLKTEKRQAGKFEYQQIPIRYHSNYFLTEMPECFSFGITDLGEKFGGNGYNVALSLFDREGATKRQAKFYKFLKEVVANAEAHMKLAHPDISLSNISPLRGTEEKPMLYLKYDGKSRLLDVEGAEIYPDEVKGAFRVKAMIHVSHVFVGKNSCALKLKLYEAKLGENTPFIETPRPSFFTV